MLSFEIMILLGIAGLLLAMAPAYIFLGLWVYHDAKDRSEQSPALWVLVVLLLSNMLGLVIYLLVGRNKPGGVSSGRYKKAAIIGAVFAVLAVPVFVVYVLMLQANASPVGVIETFYVIPAVIH